MTITPAFGVADGCAAEPPSRRRSPREALPIRNDSDFVLRATIRANVSNEKLALYVPGYLTIRRSTNGSYGFPLGFSQRSRCVLFFFFSRNPPPKIEREQNVLDDIT